MSARTSPICVRPSLTPQATQLTSLFFSVIGAAHHWAGLDDLESALQSFFLEDVELLGRDPAIDGQVIARRLKILPDGQDVGLGVLTHIVHKLKHFVIALPDAKHDAGLGHKAAVFDTAQNLQGSFILSLGSHGWVHSANRFHIVGQNLGVSMDDRSKRGRIALEVSNQRLDGHLGTFLMDLPDGLSPNLRAAIGQVVAIDAGDDYVLQAHQRQ